MAATPVGASTTMRLREVPQPPEKCRLAGVFYLSGKKQVGSRLLHYAEGKIHLSAYRHGSDMLTSLRSHIGASSV